MEKFGDAEWIDEVKGIVKKGEHQSCEPEPQQVKERYILVNKITGVKAQLRKAHKREAQLNVRAKELDAMLDEQEKNVREVGEEVDQLNKTLGKLWNELKEYDDSERRSSGAAASGSRGMTMEEADDMLSAPRRQVRRELSGRPSEGTSTPRITPMATPMADYAGEDVRSSDEERSERGPFGRESASEHRSLG